uniref:Protein translocase subunit SecA n=1 Tax=uncultured SAR11 cluster alpha proteobacterium H17925_38M03 TaxID=715037 RepID=E7CA10_9PROT|nr:Preprotein translocase subunit SecA (ATPase, RNA helicase) [uncultured SAR11 cluster alpha proteobacterium H17925_38M03]
MNLFTRTFSKIFKSSNQQELDKIQNIIEAINAKESEIKTLSEADFKAKTFNFKKNAQNGSLKLNEIIPESFAMVREAAKRTLGERHYDVQLAGGLILHNGKIAEMKTGEGKTLVSTLPAYLNSLSGKGVHVVTVNDYLAKRDAEWMGKVFNYLGVSTGCITNDLDDIERKKNYRKDITYATNNELGFDYLRDNMKYELEDMVQRDHNFCIVDEVDSILIDESRTPLIISGKLEDKTTLYVTSNDFIKLLEKEDYELDEKNKNAILTDPGIDKVEKLAIQKRILKNNNFYDPANLDLVHHINQALKANLLFKKDKDYIVREGKVQIIDEFTGRVLDGRRFSDGLHQAIESKEKVQIQEENQTLASITYQNYFRLYKKLAGMTGTAMTESEEFFDIYKLNVVSIPTNKEMLRKDFNDQIYRTEKEKYNAISNKVIECNNKGQPVLVGTTSIEKSEKISNYLTSKKIKHNVLNAKHHEQEAKIIAEAGKIGAVTIATNMAGRGTDIKLGGNKDFILDGKKENIEEIRNNEKKVKELGGLFIVGTERHESRRIDNQLRGRSGRQGDPGSTIFFISLQDELMRIFGGDSIDGMLKKLGLKENESIDHPWINKAMERAQKKVESRNFDIRKTLIKFDDVMNDQRQVIFSQRLKILRENNIEIILNDFFDEILKNLNLTRLNFQKSGDEKKYLTEVKNITGNSITDDNLRNYCKLKEGEFTERIKNIYLSKKNSRIEILGQDQNNILEKKIFLQIIDFSWRSHLQYLEQLRQVIGLRQYGQKDPLSEFKKEAFVLFEGLLSKIKNDLIKFLLNLSVVISNKDQKKQDTEVIENKLDKKVGRNEKCPCGSGKKFKHCHGNI